MWITTRYRSEIPCFPAIFHRKNCNYNAYPQVHPLKSAAIYRRTFSTRATLQGIFSRFPRKSGKKLPPQKTAGNLNAGPTSSSSFSADFAAHGSVCSGSFAN
jgi:hypothetical protein